MCLLSFDVLEFHSICTMLALDLFENLYNARTRQASSQCLNRRVVFLYTMHCEKRYSAPEELVTLLMERGLVIEKKELADKFHGRQIVPLTNIPQVGGNFPLCIYRRETC